MSGGCDHIVVSVYRHFLVNKLAYDILLIHKSINKVLI